jgi:hypothetical protein
MHMVDEDVIRGRMTGDGSFVFDPNATITFEEATAMLVRALGHTGLTFPHGYRTRAEQIGLIGHSVLTDFSFSDALLASEVTRNDMAGLLYNFLLNERVEVHVHINPITGVITPTERGVPVLNLFGIQALTAYVVGVENYAMTLNLEAYNAIGMDPGFVGGTTTFTGDAITPAQILGTGILGTSVDVQLAFANPVRNAAGTQTGWSAQQNIMTTFDAIGLETPEEIPAYMANRYWLGRRITVFRHASAAMAGRPLPSAISVGTRTLTDNEINTADFSRPIASSTGTNVVGFVNSLSLDDGTGRAVTFTQRIGGSDTEAGTEINQLNPEFNLYAWQANGRLRVAEGATVGTGVTGATVRANEANLVNQLAAMAREDGNYQLWFIDNGLDARGEPAFFYEFIPFSSGVFRDARSHADSAHNDNSIRMENAGIFSISGAAGRHYNVGNRSGLRIVPAFADVYTPINNATMTAANVVTALHGGGAAGDLRNRGFLYTIFGANSPTLILHEELTRTTNVTVTGRSNAVEERNGATIGFNLADRPTATFTRESGAAALGAIGSAVARNPDRSEWGSGAVSGTNAGFPTLELRAVVDLYEDSHGRILTRREVTRGEPMGRVSGFTYAVVTNTRPMTAATVEGQAPGANDEPDVHISGGLNPVTNRVVRVLFAGETEDRIISLRNATTPTGPNVNNLRAGELLALAPNADGQTWSWNVVTAVTTGTPNATGIDAAGTAAVNTVGLAIPVGVNVSETGRPTDTHHNAAGIVRRDSYMFDWRRTVPSWTAGIMDGAAAAFNTQTNLLTVPSAGTSTWGRATNNLSVRIENATRVIVFGTENGAVAAPGNWTAQTFTGAQMRGLEEVIDAAYRVVAVSNNAQTGIATADIVFIATTAPIGLTAAAAPERFAIVTSELPTLVAEYTIINAVSIVDGAVRVAVPRATIAPDAGTLIEIDRSATATHMGFTTFGYIGVSDLNATPLWNNLPVTNFSAQVMNVGANAMLTPASERAAIVDLDGATRIARIANIANDADATATQAGGIPADPRFSLLDPRHDQQNRNRNPVAAAGVLPNATVWGTTNAVGELTVIGVRFNRQGTLPPAQATGLTNVTAGGNALTIQRGTTVSNIGIAAGNPGTGNPVLSSDNTLPGVTVTASGANVIVSVANDAVVGTGGTIHVSRSGWDGVTLTITVTDAPPSNFALAMADAGVLMAAMTARGGLVSEIADLNSALTTSIIMSIANENAAYLFLNVAIGVARTAYNAAAAAAATATVANTSIVGVQESPDGTVAATPVSGTAVITLVGDTFVAASAANADAWITNLPAGVTATVTATAGANTATITFAGTPTATSSDAIGITIPTAAMTIRGTDLNVTANASAVFAITQHPNP